MVSTRQGTAAAGGSTPDAADDAQLIASVAHTSVPDQTSGADSETLQANLQAVEERIQYLERLKEAKEKERTLQAELAALTAEDPENPLNRRRRESSSSSGGEVKMTNLPTFTMDYTYRSRDLWIRDLERAFEGARKRYRNDLKKCFKALDQMSTECKERWYRYTDENPALEDFKDWTWEGMRDWTATLLKDADNALAYLIFQYERAHQLPDQSPTQFDAYLASIEKQIADRPEAERAYTFLAKLIPTLREKIRMVPNKLPETRADMVAMATRLWDTGERGQKRKGEDHGRPRPNPNDRPSYGSSNRNQSRPRGAGSGRTQFPNRPTTGPNATPQRQRSGKLRCYNCNSEHHLAPDCPRRGNPSASDSKTPKA
jgi:hypothetical protein